MTMKQPKQFVSGLTRLLVGLLVVVTLSGQEPTQPPLVEWAPDSWVVVAANGLLARFDLNSDEEELLDDSVITFALSPDGARLAVADLQGLTVRSYPDYEQVASLETAAPDAGGSGSVPTATLFSLAWSPEGATLAGGTPGGHILLWDVETGELWADVGVEPASPVTRLTFSAEGTRLLSAFEDGRAVLWDIEQRVVVHQFSSPHAAREGNPTGTAAMVLSPDSRRILATRLQGKEAQLVMLNDHGKVEWRRTGYGVEFSSDGAAVLALAPPFRIAALYRASNAEALHTFEPPDGVRVLHAVRLSPDGKQLLGMGEDFYGQIIVVWDFATARILKTRR